MLPEEVIAIRKSLMMNQTEFANAINVHQHQVWEWENGIYTPKAKSYQKMLRLIDKVNMRVDSILKKMKGRSIAYLFIDSDDEIEVSAMRVAYITLLRRSVKVFLTKIDKEDYNKWNKSGLDTDRRRIKWAKSYRKERRFIKRKPEPSEYEYPWLSSYE